MNMPSLTPEDFINIPLKRKWWILLSIAVCLGLSVVAWIYYPKTFKSTTIVTIDSARVSKDLVRGLSREDRSYEDPFAIVMQQVTLGLTKKSLLLPVLDIAKPYSDAEDTDPDQLMKRLRRAITVGKPKDGIGIAISYLHSDPHTAQAVTALLASKLQEDNLKNREGVVENTAEFVSAELERVKADLEVKEHAISDFKRAHLGELPQQMEANLRTLDRLQTDLTSSTDSLSKLGERLTALERAIKDYSDLGPAAATIPFERDRRGGEVRSIDPRATRVKELKQKLSELLATYKESYPDIVYLKEEIHRLESLPAPEPAPVGLEDSTTGPRVEEGTLAQRKTIDPYLRELLKERNDLKAEMTHIKEKQLSATRQIKEIESRVERIPTREQSLAVLLRDYDSMQKNYQSLLEKRTSARVLENYESKQFGEQYRIIEPANFPDGPEPPQRIHFLLGGLVLGCLVGFGSAIGIELTKTGFRRPEEAETLLGLPVIASIPSFMSVTSGMGVGQSRALLGGPGVPTTSAGSYLGQRGKLSGPLMGKSRGMDSSKVIMPKFHMISKWGPTSLIAEQYRVAATRLILMTSEKKHAVTLITSSVMGEGKTTTAVNLAYILSHDLGRSTLLIDCDLKRPMVHEYSGTQIGPGLADILQGTATIDGCLHRYDELPLWILPAGTLRAPAIGLSAIQHLKKILPDLQARYDHIILDCPPVLPLADVNVLSGMADMVAFVIRAGGTGQDIVKKAMKSLGDVNQAGIILTSVEMEYAPYFMYAAPYVTEDHRSRV